MPSRTVEMTATLRALPTKENMGGTPGSGGAAPRMGLSPPPWEATAPACAANAVFTNSVASSWLMAPVPAPVRARAHPATVLSDPTTDFVRRLRARDPAAWFELWENFGPVLRAQLGKWGKGRIGPETVKDLSQETLAALSDAIDRHD